MNNYRLIVPVEKASGWQEYRVTAESPKEAIKAFQKGEAEFVHEEIEVTSLGEPEILEE